MKAHTLLMLTIGCAFAFSACSTTTLPWFEYSERAHTRNIINKIYESDNAVDCVIIPAQTTSDATPYRFFEHVRDAVASAGNGDTILVLRRVAIDSLEITQKSLTIAATNIALFYDAASAPPEGNIFTITRWPHMAGVITDMDTTRWRSSYKTLREVAALKPYERLARKLPQNSPVVESPARAAYGALVVDHISVAENASLTLVGLLVGSMRGGCKITSRGQLHVKDCYIDDASFTTRGGYVDIDRTILNAAPQAMHLAGTSFRFRKIGLARSSSSKGDANAAISINGSEGVIEDCQLDQADIKVSSSKIRIGYCDVGSVNAATSSVIKYAALTSNARPHVLYADGSSSLDGDGSVVVSTEEMRQEAAERARREEMETARQERERRERQARMREENIRQLGPEWERAKSEGLSYFVGTWIGYYKDQRYGKSFGVELTLKPIGGGRYQLYYETAWENFRDWNAKTREIVDRLTWEINDHGAGIIGFARGSQRFAFVARTADLGWTAIDNMMQGISIKLERVRR